MGVIWIFGGTSEGRMLAGFCSENRLPAVVSVATEYGEQILSEERYGAIMQGRMCEKQMKEYIQTQGVSLVIDATHPYAVEATGNIRRACETEGTEYIRLRRKSVADSKSPAGVVNAGTVLEAVDFLAGTEGNIMLTTGSKDLSLFCKGLEKKRLYPRVLPSAESIGSCEANGIPLSNCIAMQGPCSEAVNVALLQQFECRYLVTKESGSAGGYAEKLTACEKAAVIPVVIGRPIVEEGLELEQVCGYLTKKYGIQMEKKPEQGAEHRLKRKPEQLYEQTKMAGRTYIHIVGIGMGTEGTMTKDAEAVIHKSEVLIGGKRMLKQYEDTGKILFDCYQADNIRRFIDGLKGDRQIAVLMSGDVGFYSGTRKLLEALDGYKVRLYPGISSVVYMASKLGLAWQDMALCSLHGRKQNLLAKIRHNENVFALAGSGADITGICAQLLKAGMEQVMVYVGENLSCGSERIWNGSPQDGLKETFDSLCVAVFVNPDFIKPAGTSCIPDEEFIRGKAPMTKEEVRTISIAKLGLTRDAVVYDIGAGTGSVSIEAALAAEDGLVYAIEKKEEAADLIQVNADKFGVTNINVIRGLAPAAIYGLPKPTHAFIGGSSGNLKDIITTLQEKNPGIRIVINAISLETIAEITELSKTYQMELLMVTVAKAGLVGNYHLMMGQNPVMIGTMKGR